MPLDNRERRASAVSLTQSAPPTPTPNAGMDQEWRQESGWGYAAILVGVPVPPPPIPPPVEVAARVGVAVPKISRRVFALWKRELRQWWIDYFEEVLQLSQAQARLRAEEIVKSADAIKSKQSSREFWKKYFDYVQELENTAYAIQLDDEEITILL